MGQVFLPEDIVRGSAISIPISISMSLENTAARVLPLDVLRMIYLEYCKVYSRDTTNRMQLKCVYLGPDGKLHAYRAKLRVMKRFRDSRHVIYLNDRRVIDTSLAMEPEDLDRVVKSAVFGNKWLARHHRMDVVCVCAGKIRGDFKHRRPMRDIRMKVDVSGPYAFFSRVVRTWLEWNDIPISRNTHIRDVIRGRAVKLGDGLPPDRYFR